MKSSRKIYNQWLSKTLDRRYLRPNRWDEIEKVILENNVKSVLEFGSGVSTLLFDSMNLTVISVETDKSYIDFIKPLCSSNVILKYWNNDELPLGSSQFDLSLVDGILPRLPQLEIALQHSKIVAIDDFAGSHKKNFLPYMKKFKRLDSGETFMAIFKIV